MSSETTRLNELFAYIESFVNLERGDKSTRVFRLDRMRALLDRTDHPERRRATIHIAGSKGKGSVAIMAASILKELGFRTGVYLSPHVQDYRERFFIAGETVAIASYIDVLARIRDLVETRIRPETPEAELPTAFELLTLAGFLLFREEDCDWQVIETGLGGRLDATNVVIPDVTVLTPIELEHTEYLGETIPEIAGEKAGIIKPGAPAITGRQRPEALRVFEEKSASVGVPLFVADPRRLVASNPGGGYTFRLPIGELNVVPGMPGEHQAENALLALTTILSQIPDADPEALRRGIEKARLPGRFEVARLPGRFKSASEAPPVVLDGAHTPDSLKLFLEELKRRYPDIDTLIFGPVAGKRYQELAPLVTDFASTVVLCSGLPKRPVDMPGLTKALREAEEALGNRATEAVNPARTAASPDRRGSPEPLSILQAQSVAQAVAWARNASGGRGFAVTGSFYLVGAVKEALSSDDLPSSGS